MPNLHFGGPLRSARRKIGAADDDRQPAADAGRCRLRRGTDPTRVRGSLRYRAPIFARTLINAKKDQEAARRLKQEAAPAISHHEAATTPQLIFSDLTPDIRSSTTCRRVSSQSPFAASPARAVDPGRARSTPSARPRNDKPPAKARGDR